MKSFSTAIRVVLLWTLLIACTSTSGNRETQNTFQTTVNAMLALTQGLETPEHFRAGDSVKREGDFDVNAYFTVLKHLSVQPGYVLDYVYLADFLGGKPLIYARPQEQSPYTTYFEYIDAVGGATQRSYEYLDQSVAYLEHIQIDDTAAGYFEFVTLYIHGDHFYLDWHGNYSDETIVCNKEGAASVLAATDAVLYSSKVPAQIRQRAMKLDFTPRVTFTKEKATVRVVTFTKWGGFAEIKYTITREFPHHIVDWEVNTLLEYDCGIVF